MGSLVQKDFARAIKLLLDNGVHLVTWGDQVLKSHGYPALVMVNLYSILSIYVDH
jgi:hypothetical protein